MPLYGYAKRGTPCIIKRPSGWKQQTLLLAISNRGHAFHRVIPGSCNGSKFREFVSNMPFPPGTVLIMDNVSFHHRDDAYAQRSFSPLYTPPYCPEYNPVEMAFSKVKNAFRNHAGHLGSVADKVDACVRSLRPTDITGFFRHAVDLVDARLSGRDV